MLFCDRDIEVLIEEGMLKVHPWEPSLLQPASLDIRLDRFFRIFNNQEFTHIDPAKDMRGLTTLVEKEPDEPFILHPGELVLASTLEHFSVSKYIAARVEGKSSLGRLGLLTHATAGWIDPGFTGWVTLELFNVTNLPIRLTPGMTIGQLCVFQLTREPKEEYGKPNYSSKYQNSVRGPTPSKANENFTVWGTERPWARVS